MSVTSIAQTAEADLIAVAAITAETFIAIHGARPQPGETGQWGIPCWEADIFLETGVTPDGAPLWTLTAKTNTKFREIVTIAIITNHDRGAIREPHLAYINLAYAHLLPALCGCLERLALPEAA